MADFFSASLPDEVIYKLLDLLSAHDLARLMCVSTSAAIFAERVEVLNLLVRLSPNEQCQSHATNKALGTIFMHTFVH